MSISDPSDATEKNKDLPPDDSGSVNSKDPPGDEEKITFNPLIVAVEELGDHGTKTVTLEDLFRRFVKMEPEERLKVVDAYLLAKAIAKGTGATVTVEFIKELGRNERALLRVDKGGGSDEDIPWG